MRNRRFRSYGAISRVKRFANIECFQIKFALQVNENTRFYAEGLKKTINDTYNLNGRVDYWRRKRAYYPDCGNCLEDIFIYTAKDIYPKAIDNILELLFLDDEVNWYLWE